MRFVIDLVEIDAQCLIRHVEAFIDPPVHGFPQRIYFRIFGLPAAQPLLRLSHDRSVFLGLLLALPGGDELLDLGFVVLVEFDVIFTDQVVAFHPRRGGRFAAAVEFPGQHRLADVNTAVVHEVYLDDLVAVGFQDLRDGVSQQVVADVSQVKGLVGVGRGVFDHYGTARRCGLPEGVVCRDLPEACGPECTVEREIQESLDYVERLDFRRIGHQVFADLRRRGFGRLAAGFEQGEHHERIVALELFAGFLNLQRSSGIPVEGAYRRCDFIRKKLFNIHRMSNLGANLRFLSE